MQSQNLAMSDKKLQGGKRGCWWCKAQVYLVVLRIGHKSSLARRVVSGRGASKIYRSIKMIARPAAASETAFRGFISRRCIKHAYSRQVAGERNWTTIPGDLFTRLAARSITFHRQPEMNGLFARCFHDTRLPANAIFLLRWQKGLLSLNSLSIWRNVFI